MVLVISSPRILCGTAEMARDRLGLVDLAPVGLALVGLAPADRLDAGPALCWAVQAAASTTMSATPSTIRSARSRDRPSDAAGRSKRFT